MTRRWTPEEDAALMEHYLTCDDIRVLASSLGRSVEAVHQHAKVLGCGFRKRRPYRWTAEMDAALTELYPDHTNAEIAEAIGVKEKGVDYRAYKLGLRKDKEWMLAKSRATSFKKGHVPSNKGRKWDEYMSAEKQENARRTCFKKGNMPHNHRPLGWERRSKDGYLEVKVAEPNVFRPKHRILWEEHYGPIPDGMSISFIDGDKDNVTIGNLRMETMREKFERCCSIHTTLPPELRRMVQVKGALMRQINKIEGKKPRKRTSRNED